MHLSHPYVGTRADASVQCAELYRLWRLDCSILPLCTVSPSVVLLISQPPPDRELNDSEPPGPIVGRVFRSLVVLQTNAAERRAPFPLSLTSYLRKRIRPASTQGTPEHCGISKS